MLGVGTAGATAVDGVLPAGGADDHVQRDRPVVRPQEREAWAVLAGVRGLGPVGFGALLARYGSGVAILGEAASPGGPERIVAVADTSGFPPIGDGVPITIAVAEGIASAAHAAGATIARIRELGLTILTIEDPAYPLRLAAIEMPPHVLYVLGDPAAMGARSAIAVVGTRRPTDAGRAVAARIAANLAAVGSVVVSGLAVGIDGAAHAATIHAGGTTVAVIGSGHAVLHPRVHGRLAASIVAAGGAIVSELGPDIGPSRGTFPRRNRVISGMADATVVVEAPARSGALITASWALEQGRDCYLVPGAIDAPASAGCLAFLREFPEATRIVAGIPQLIDDLGLADHLATPRVTARAAATLADVGEAAGRLGRELLMGRSTVDELIAATGWPVASVLAGLTLLERRGLAVGAHGRFRPSAGLASGNGAPTGQRPRASRRSQPPAR